MTKNKLVLTSFIAFAMITMVATAIVTQEAYAGDSFCDKNYQGSFHASPAFPSLSVPRGYPGTPWTPLCLPDNSLSPVGGFPISDH